MKHFAITIFTVFLSCVCVFSQRDTTENSSEKLRNERPDPSLPTGVQPPIPDVNANQNVNPLIRIRMDAIPYRMRNLLKENRYKGWEKADVFQNRETFEYSIDIRQGDSLKTFSFDRFGNPRE